ncbi:XRE family transcriptional regulator [Mucilaginibacter conchicola]|uniref:XRE family transcriptional regulator n=1 Tax=Mucilaginibacter conchicola TaxID=2303333 RepID=A0A372NMC3_9SPHI|nr:helix-turn-helix transcriptional regulator [Mucilaginibacter conchicola]RFZ90091.1 XRE family transcriptional regulator [Mucilaginibacter conchicola]
MKKRNTSKINAKAKDLVAAAISNIQQIRTVKKIPQQAIADALGVSQNAYSKIEKGHTRLQLESLFVISKVLGVKISEILDFDDTPKWFK